MSLIINDTKVSETDSIDIIMLSYRFADDTINLDIVGDFISG